MVGSSGEQTGGVLLRDGIVAFDIQITKRFWSFTYYSNLISLLFKYKPCLIIVLGLLNVLPVSIYSLFSLKSRYILVFIGEFSYYGEKKINQILMTFGLRLLGILLRLSKRNILSAFSISKYTREGIENLAPSLSGKIKLVSYPISPIFNSAQLGSFPRNNKELTVLTVAGIEPRKGLDVLVKAVSLLPKEIKVIIKGSIRDNTYMNKLMNMIRMLGIEDRVTFITDIVNYDNLVSYYRSADIFVLPSREESLGVVILEALHCGVPVIATSVGGIPEMIENGVNGILVKPDDPKELADSIVMLLSDNILRGKLNLNSRLTLINRYYKNRIKLKEALMKSVAFLI